MAAFILSQADESDPSGHVDRRHWTAKDREERDLLPIYPERVGSISDLLHRSR